MTVGGRGGAGVRVAAFDMKNGRLGVGGREIACDALLVSAGSVPQIQLASQAGSAPVFDPSIGAFLPGISAVVITTSLPATTFSISSRWRR